MQSWFDCTVCTVTVYLAGPTSYADGGGAAYLFRFSIVGALSAFSGIVFIKRLRTRPPNFPSTSFNIVKINPSAEPCGSTSTWACIHVDFQNVASALPPLGLPRGNSRFPVEHLTLSCCLRLVRHYKERDGSPPLLILSGYHRDEGEKCPGCRFRFEFSCCRNTEGTEH